MADKQSKPQEHARRLASFTEWRTWQANRHFHAQANQELDDMLNAGAAEVERCAPMQEQISQVSAMHTQMYGEHGEHCSDLQAFVDNDDFR